MHKLQKMIKLLLITGNLFQQVPKYLPWIYENMQNYSNVPAGPPRDPPNNQNRKPNKMNNRQYRQKRENQNKTKTIVGINEKEDKNGKIDADNK